MYEGVKKFMLQFSIISIAAFVAGGNECIKLIGRSLNKDWNKYIPICSLVIGVILGLAGYFIPNVDMGNNIVEAIFIGLSAGASATGVHQVGKQLMKEDKKEQSFSIPVDTIYEAMNAVSSSSKEDEEIPTDPDEVQNEIIDFDDYSDDE